MILLDNIEKLMSDLEKEREQAVDLQEKNKNMELYLDLHEALTQIKVSLQEVKRIYLKFLEKHGK